MKEDVIPITLASASQPAEKPTWRPAPPEAIAAAAASSEPAENAAPPLSTTDVTPIPTRDVAVPTIDRTPAPVASSPKPAAQPAESLSDALARRLSDIEMRLSRVVAEQPAMWQIDPLAREAEQLLAQTQTAAERSAVQSTLTKIDRFAAIGRRYRESQTIVNQSNSDSRQPSLDSPQPTSDSLGYDAVGILRPVVSKRPGAPQFALLNDVGQVVSFVTPTPDVNLQPYVGRRIGVTGSRGYIPEFQRAHVTAGRVSPLNERLLR
jgi:hypothetical protein